MALLSITRNSVVRLAISLAIAITIFIFCYISSASAPRLETRNYTNPTDGLEVTLNRTDTSQPLTIITTVTNKNEYPITILKYNSPLDDNALDIGLFSITPSGSSQPLALPTVQIRRLWPPRPDSLLELGAGASKTVKTVLVGDIVSQLQDKASIVVTGRWDMVWAYPKKIITDAALEQIHFSADISTGEFSSGVLEIYAK